MWTNNCPLKLVVDRAFVISLWTLFCKTVLIQLNWKVRSSKKYLIGFRSRLTRVRYLYLSVTSHLFMNFYNFSLINVIISNIKKLAFIWRNQTLFLVSTNSWWKNQVASNSSLCSLVTSKRVFAAESWSCRWKWHRENAEVFLKPSKVKRTRKLQTQV